MPILVTTVRHNLIYIQDLSYFINIKKEVYSFRLPISFIQFISNVDSLDWKNYGVDAIVSTVLNHKALGNGSIILMHNGAKYTKDALPTVIEGLQKKGFEIVPISKLIYKDNYEINHEGRQISLDKATKKD